MYVVQTIINWRSLVKMKNFNYYFGEIRIYLIYI
nr:MAG TPA: hypothetical protein [Caudoviricetes sp.]